MKRETMPVSPKLCPLCRRIFPSPKGPDKSQFFLRAGVIRKRVCPPCSKQRQEQEQRKAQQEQGHQESMLESLLERSDLPPYVEKYLLEFHGRLTEGKELTLAQSDLLRRTYHRATNR